MTDAPTQLTILAQGTRMLAEARTLDDVRTVRDLAAAARVYAKAHGLGIEARNHAGAIVIEADIRTGEILREMAENGERHTGHGDQIAESQKGIPLLVDLNVTSKQSSAAQAIAAEAGAVRTWMAKAKDIAPTRAARVARDAKAKREREAQPPPILPAACDLRFGDFREVLADVSDASVDVILTDPPYPAKFLPLWSDLAVFAKRTLKPTGMLVAMSGQANLPDVMARLGKHLEYRWTIAYQTPGASLTIHARRVSTQWKPVLIYGSTERWIFDVARSDREDKEHHDWGQSESGMADLLRLVADPGAKVCDPFVGGGTTALISIAAGCSFIGAEIDPDIYAKASQRLATA